MTGTVDNTRNVHTRKPSMLTLSLVLSPITTTVTTTAHAHASAASTQSSTVTAHAAHAAHSTACRARVVMSITATPLTDRVDLAVIQVIFVDESDARVVVEIGGGRGVRGVGGVVMGGVGGGVEHAFAASAGAGRDLKVFEAL